MLTKREHDAWIFICNYVQEHGIAPTTHELAQGIGISSRGVAHRYISELERKNYIRRQPGRRRNIHLNRQTESAHTHGSVPLVGTIAAGQPIEAVKQNESVSMGDLFLGKNRYALRVRGDSMIDEGILDGDIVICERRQQAQNGQIIVALIDNEVATLKRFLSNGDETVTLLPANACHEPQIYHQDRLTIQGVFVGLMRLALDRL